MTEQLFEFVAARLEQATELDKLEARGTLRIALKRAGLEPRGVTAEQMAVLLRRAMPEELTTRGVGEAGSICESVAGELAGFAPGTGTGAGAGAGVEATESPEEVFRRLGER